MYGQWTYYFEPNKLNRVMNAIKDSFFVHVWNSMGKLNNVTYKIDHNSKAAYAELARKYCPKVFATLDKYF